MATDDKTLEWRQAQGYPVEVREDGVIRRTSAKGRWPAGHIIAPFVKPGGKTVFVSITASDGSRPLVPLAEFIARVYLGPPPCPHSVAVYKDGDATNNHWTNLQWEVDARYAAESPDREWRMIEDFPQYEVSNDGHVRKMPSLDDRYAARELKASQDKGGYFIVRLYREDGSHQDQSIHRLVAKAFLGEPPLGQEHVAHRDGNPSHNHFTNLRWSTVKENMADRVLHGTAPMGERHARAKINEDTVREIRRIFPTLGKGGIKRLADQIGIAPCNVTNIAAGRTWKHILEVK